MIIINEGKTLNLSLFAPIVTNDLEWTVSYFDTQKGCTGCSTCDTQKEDEGTNDGADPSVILTAPDTNTNTTIFTKSVKYLNVYNADTTTNTVTITLDSKVIFKTVLPSGYNLVYNEESGWMVYTNYGGPAGGGSGVPVSVSPTYYARMADDGSGLVNGWMYQDASSVLFQYDKKLVASDGGGSIATTSYNGYYRQKYTDGVTESIFTIGAGFGRIETPYNVIQGNSQSLFLQDSNYLELRAPYAIVGQTGGFNGTLKFANNTNSNMITIMTDVIPADYTLTLPTAQAGGANYALVNNGSGILSWVAMPSGGVTSVTGTANRITSSGGSTPVIDIAGTYVGQASIITLGTVTTGTWTATTIAANKGGTGFSSYAVGDLLYADTTSTLAKLADVATGNALISGGVTIAPSWGKIALTTHISGILPSANGGTGVNNSSTITIAGNLITTGAFNTTFAAQATITTTLPSVATTLVGKTGTMAANYISYWNDANQLTGNSLFTYASNNLLVGGTTADIYSLGTSNFLNIQSQSGNAARFQIIADGTSTAGFQGGNATIRRGGLSLVDGSTMSFFTNPTNSGPGLTEKFTLTSLGNVILGNQSALATNSTDGFAYIPTSAGAPTGTPTSYTGKVAMEYDTTNNLFKIYNGGWKNVSAISGSVSQVGTATTTFTVTIGATQANSTYKVNVTPTNLLSAAAFYVNNKTTTTFDVVYLAGLTGTVTFDWALFP